MSIPETAEAEHIPPEKHEMEIISVFWRLETVEKSMVSAYSQRDLWVIELIPEPQIL